MPPEDVLISYDKLSPHFPEVRERAGSFPALSIDPDNVQGGQPLLAYLVLAHCSDLLDADENTPERIYYSKYYWFKRFVLEYTTQHGADAGLEQQAFQLLEDDTVVPDWALLEEIDHLASTDAA